MPPVDLRVVCLVRILGGSAGMGACHDGPGGSSPVFIGTDGGDGVAFGIGLCPTFMLLWGIRARLTRGGRRPVAVAVLMITTRSSFGWSTSCCSIGRSTDLSVIVVRD